MAPVSRAHGGGSMRETGAICQIVIFIWKRCIFGGRSKGPFQAFGAIKISECAFQILSPFGANEGFKRHRSICSQMLYFAVFGHQDPFGLISVKSRPTIRSRPGKPNQRKGQNEKFMNFAHFCEFWCFFLGKTSTIHKELLFRNAPAKSS